MPELPEVETVRAGLAPHIEQRRIARVDVLHPRPVRRHPGGPDDFATTLVGRRFTSPRRRGKYLWLPFDDGDALLAHLGMSGQFRVNEPVDPLAPHTRVVFGFDEGPEVRFIDQRMFGGLSLSPGGAELPAEISHIALDPFDEHFDRRAVVRRMRSRHVGVKRQLLDQTLMSGIGNIYADEALWAARLHGETPGDLLSARAAGVLVDAARDVMASALAQGGTSFDALYVRVNGTSGYFGRDLNAYGREGLPCPRCGTTMVRQQFMNRSSCFCPRCQRIRSGAGSTAGRVRAAPRTPAAGGDPAGDRVRSAPAKLAGSRMESDPGTGTASPSARVATTPPPNTGQGFVPSSPGTGSEPS